jgi:hypothetical protein
VLDVLTPAVVEAAACGGYILDGLPRTLPQATAAADLAARLGVTLDAAIYLHAPDEVLTRRLLDRASQSGRSDDKADVIRHRLQVFAETTGLLVPTTPSAASWSRSTPTSHPTPSPPTSRPGWPSSRGQQARDRSRWDPGPFGRRKALADSAGEDCTRSHPQNAPVTGMVINADGLVMTSNHLIGDSGRWAMTR